MATIKEIAKHIGASPSTVSIVLSGKASVRKISPEMQRRVLEAAHELGYQPSLEARRLRATPVRESRESLTLALFWRLPLRETLLVRYLQGSQQVLNDGSRVLTQNIYFYEPGALRESASLFWGNYFHAAVIYAPTDDDLDFLMNSVLPVPVLLLSTDAELARKYPHKYSMVSMDISDFALTLYKAFASSGGSRAASCQSGPSRLSEEFESAGLPYGVITAPFSGFCEGSIQGGYDWVKKQALLHQGQLPFDCLYCGSERIGLGASRAVRELGYTIPEQVRIVAVDVYNLNFEEFGSPSLSTLEIPMERMAVEAILKIEEHLQNAACPPADVKIRSTYHPRETCGPIQE